MTDDRMVLMELIEKGADGDLVCEMLAFAAERIMDGVTGAQVASLLQRVVDTVKDAPVVLAGVLEGFGYEQVLPRVAETAVPFLWGHARLMFLTARLPNLPRFVLKNRRATPVGS